MNYNMTALTKSETFSQLVSFANTAANNLFVSFMMIGVFFVLLFSLMKFGFLRAMISASFICLLISLPLTRIGLVNFLIPLMFLIITALGALYKVTLADN